MVITTLLRSNFTVQTKEALGATAMHGFLVVLPVVVGAQNRQGVVLDSQLTLASVLALQVALGNLVLLEFTMRTSGVT